MFVACLLDFLLVLLFPGKNGNHFGSMCSVITTTVTEQIRFSCHHFNTFNHNAMHRMKCIVVASSFLSLSHTLKKLLTEHDYIKMPFENYIQCPLKSHNENKTYICEKRENIVKIVAAQFFFTFSNIKRQSCTLISFFCN